MENRHTVNWACRGTVRIDVLTRASLTRNTVRGKTTPTQFIDLRVSGQL